MNKDEWEDQRNQEGQESADPHTADPSLENDAELNEEELHVDSEKQPEETYGDYEEVMDEDPSTRINPTFEGEQSVPFSAQEEHTEEKNDRMNQTEPEQKQSKKSEGTPHHVRSGLFGGLIGGLTVLLLGGGFLFGSGALSFSPNGINPPDITTENDQEPSSPVAIDVTTDSTKAIEQVQEAVVSIINMVESSGNPFGFTIPQSETEDDSNLVTQGEGSGVIYKIEGDLAYVVTNNHVISDADALEVLMKDGTKKEAELVGNDIWTDLAVLTIPVEGIETVAQFGDSDALNVGEPAIAIGSPLGINFATSATQGIISATERTVATDIDGNGVPDWDVTAIQTDASINPGNSGGALINIAGKVVGINSMKISDQNVEGMGFAIPSNDVKHVIAELEEHGEVIRPMLGVSMADLKQISASQVRSTLKIPQDVTEGVVVTDVQRLSAAEMGGLKQYDVIVEMAGEEVANMIELRKVLYAQEVGSIIEVKFYRQGEMMTQEITLTDGQPSL